MLQVIILLLAIFGGTQFFLNPVVLVGFILAYIVLVAVVIARRPTPPVVMSIFRWPVVALILAALAGGFGGWWMVCRLWLCSAALLLMLLQVDQDALRRAILTAGAAYPLTLLMQDDNRNIQAVWPLIAAAATLAGPASAWRWGYFGLQIVLLLWLGSRGALLGLAAALACAAYWNWRVVAFMVGLLAVLRPDTALVRFYYWRLALTAFLERPIVGGGPGSIRAMGRVVEGGVWHPHAHNIFLSLLAEGGLVGLAGLIMAIRQAWAIRHKLQIERWQVALLVGLAAHSMVDEPLWWPGPLLMTALVIGSIGEKQCPIKL